VSDPGVICTCFLELSAQHKQEDLQSLMLHLSVTEMVDQISKLSQGTLLGKIDTRQAYHKILLPHHLLGMQWVGNFFVYHLPTIMVADTLQ